jgi:hypothetical protein
VAAAAGAASVLPGARVVTGASVAAAGGRVLGLAWRTGVRTVVEPFCGRLQPDKDNASNTNRAKRRLFFMVFFRLDYKPCEQIVDFVLVGVWSAPNITKTTNFLRIFLDIFLDKNIPFKVYYVHEYDDLECPG